MFSNVTSLCIQAGQVEYSPYGLPALFKSYFTSLKTLVLLRGGGTNHSGYVVKIAAKSKNKFVLAVDTSNDARRFVAGMVIGQAHWPQEYYTSDFVLGSAAGTNTIEVKMVKISKDGESEAEGN